MQRQCADESAYICPGMGLPMWVAFLLSAMGPSNTNRAMVLSFTRTRCAAPFTVNTSSRCEFFSGPTRSRAMVTLMV